MKPNNTHRVNLPDAIGCATYDRSRLVRDHAIIGADARPCDAAMQYSRFHAGLRKITMQELAPRVPEVPDMLRAQGIDLADDAGFFKAFGKWPKMIYREGIVVTIQYYVKGN